MIIKWKKNLVLFFIRHIFFCTCSIIVAFIVEKVEIILPTSMFSWITYSQCYNGKLQLALSWTHNFEPRGLALRNSASPRDMWFLLKKLHLISILILAAFESL